MCVPPDSSPCAATACKPSPEPPASNQRCKWLLTEFGWLSPDGNRRPDEVANMMKWGKVLSQADTFDDEILEKQDGPRGR